MNSENQSWNLESFVNALVVELDKTRETLAVKAINKPLSYTVKDMSLDLQIFPTYDGDQVLFKSAKPGEEGSSKISLQLASITDQQVRATSKKPSGKDDIKIDNIDIDPETKKTLRSIGVTSIKDLEAIDRKNVDLGKVGHQKINYTNLANLLEKAKRDKTPPKVNKVSLSLNENETKPILIIEGENLSMHKNFAPVAIFNNRLANIIKADKDQVLVSIDEQYANDLNKELILTLDPYSIFKINIKE